MIFRTRTISFIGLAVVGGALLVLSFRSPGVVTKEASGRVSLTVDFGDPPAGGVREWRDISLVTGATAFSILKEEIARVGLALYSSEASSAGVFVRQIGDKKNGDGGRYWQYWINEKFALVAADKYLLSSGDTVEWRFVEENSKF